MPRLRAGAGLAHRVGQRRAPASSRGSPFSSILIAPGLPGKDGRLTGGRRPELGEAATASAVSGASRMPLR